MTEHLLIDLGAILVLGTVSVWLAWRFRLPSILILFILGYTAGPVTGWIQTEAIFGDLLLPIVSLSVGIILFEGGLNLKLGELREIGGPLLNLITIGVAVTWGLTAVAARVLGGLDLPLSILLGAILVVTGPTVIIPMLRDIRPKGRAGPLLKWEGIVIDPLGAVLAVLTFEAVFVTEAFFSPSAALQVIVLTVISGTVLGLAGAFVVYHALKRYWVPDYLHNSFALTVVLTIFVAANTLQSESGLMATVVMGVALANQETVPLKQLAEFKEDLQVLLIAGLFILLSSRLPLAMLDEFSNPSTLIFLALLMVLVRPLGVLLSTFKSQLRWRDRALVAWTAPRGIVAAAVSTIFAIRMTEAGFAGADRLANLTFVTIAGTVAVYGLTTPIVARYLGLSDTDPQGFLIVGAQEWARRIGRSLQKAGVRVLMLDSNYDHIRSARMAGLETAYGSALSQTALEELDLSGIGRLLALTRNDEVNSLAALHFREVFGRGGVFQLAPPKSERRDQQEGVSTELRGRLLFGPGWTCRRLEELFEKEGTEVKRTQLTDSFSYRDFVDQHDGRAVPMFLLRASGKILVFAADEPPQPQSGDTLISAVESSEPLDRRT